MEYSFMEANLIASSHLIDGNTSIMSSDLGDAWNVQIVQYTVMVALYCIFL